MVRFHVTRDKKVWHKGTAQPVDAIIEVDEKTLPHLKGFGYIEDSSASLDAPRGVPNIETRSQGESTLPDGPKSLEEQYAEKTKSGVKK